jgi:hypothetical protein
MKSILLLLLLCNYSLLGVQCNKEEKNVPSCVTQKIKQIKAEPKWNPAAEVHEYLYQGKTVFLFTSNCCDQYIELYGEGCAYLCAPSGGFTGHGDGRCSDFYTTATYIKLIWKDPR